MALRFPSAVLQSNTHKRSNFLPFLNTRYSTKSNGFPFSSINKAPQACLSSKSHPEVRPLAHFPPDVWTNPFSSTDFDQSKIEWYDRQVKTLKQKTMDMLLASTCDYVENIMLIDILCRLGVSYHFEDAIKEQLSHIFHTKPQILNEKEYDLHTIAIVFRVFRQHGFKMSSDVFNKFKNSDGKFKSSLEKDAKGILSLYEAAHLSLPGEDILDEALTFSKQYLESSAMESFPHLRRHITNALDQPFHYGLPRLEAKKFIHLYEADESPNETLLLFAKFDYNRLQSLHQQELRNFEKWWQGLNLATEVPYARDRMLETFFWAVALNFEANNAHSRDIVSKVALLIALLDDTIDSYATIDEIHILADALERWDMSCVDQLPDYMKKIYKLFLNTYSEIEEELKVKGIGYQATFGIKAFQNLAKAFYVEAQWRNEGKVPSFDEYIQNGSITSSAAPLVPLTSFMGDQKIKGTKEFEWMMNEPKLNFIAGALIRIINDLATYKVEQKRGNVVSSVECYMKQYGVSEEEAIEHLQRMQSEYLKQINEEFMTSTQISVNILMRTVDVVRGTIVTYKYGLDGYGHDNSKSMKESVKGLLIDPISI